METSKGIEQLKQNYPELVEEYSKMSKDELLNQICLEVIDLYNMEERVSVFMEHCTMNFSKTNYTPESIKSMINEKHENDISVFCKDLLDDNGTSSEIIRQIRKEAHKLNS